jgi:hypothetical protein
MSSATLQTNGHRPPDTQNYLQATVQEFFKTCNWEDQSLEVQEIRLASLLDDNTSLPLTLRVSQFFAAVNWDGTTFANPSPVINSSDPTASNADSTFTLSDLSDLF